MRIATTTAAEINGPGHRLDGSYHASEGVKTRRALRQWSKSDSIDKTIDIAVLKESQQKYGENNLESLNSLCLPGGIFIGGRAKRIYVTDESHGIPFLSSSDMLQASFEGAKLISKKQPGLDSMLLKETWTLISRSGTVGNMAYVRKDMAGLAGSEHIMRVACDTKQVQPGYIYAFLSGNLGQSLIKLGTFGTVVDTISPEQIGRIPIPRLGSSIENQIHELVQKSADLRTMANDELKQIRSDLTQSLNLLEDFHARYDHAFAVGEASILSSHVRLDAYYYVGYAGQAGDLITGKKNDKRRLSQIASEIFNPPVFKRIYVDNSGMPYFMGFEVYETHPKPTRFLSPLTKNLDRYVLREGMIIIQDAGQRYGLLGTPIFANRTLDRIAATNNMIRIVIPEATEAGYVYAFLDTEVGNRLIVRESYGSSLPHIYPPWLGELEIPWPDRKIRSEFGERVISAFEKRATANDLEDEAQAILLDALGWDDS